MTYFWLHNATVEFYDAGDFTDWKSFVATCVSPDSAAQYDNPILHGRGFKSAQAFDWL